MSRNSSTATYLKIRKYILSILENGPDEPQPIPSMNALAKMFGVTPMTVHKALSGLVKENHLLVKKGVGTFTNPSKRNTEIPGSTPSRRIGIVTGEGKHCFYNAFYWHYISALGQTAIRKGHVVNLVNLFEVDPDNIIKEIRDTFIDGLIWVSTTQNYSGILQKLHNEHFPVVNVHSIIPNINNVSFDYFKHAYDMTKRMIDEGRQSILFVGDASISPIHLQLDGFTAACNEHGIPVNSSFILSDIPSAPQKLEELIEYGINIQAIYFATDVIDPLLAVLIKHKPKLQNKCRLICEPMEKGYPEGFSIIARDYRSDDIAREVFTILERMFSTQDFSVENKLLEFGIHK